MTAPPEYNHLLIYLKKTETTTHNKTTRKKQF